MKIKRIISAFLLIAVLLSALSACTPAAQVPEESGTIAPVETPPADPGESGDLGEATMPEEPEIEKPANPEKTLFQKSNETYGSGVLGCTGLTLLAEYNRGVDFDIKSYKDGTNKIYYLFLPCRADLSSVTFTVTHKDGSESGPYTADFSDDEVTENEKTIGGINTYSIVVMQSNLPTVMLQIDEQYGTIKNMNGDASHETYSYGKMVATVTNEMAAEKGWATRYESLDEDAARACSMRIRGRGNATWSYPKKPYHMVLENDVDLFGMGSANKFVFLANVKDAAGMRTQLALDMGILSGIEYTSESRQVDLFMNGEYLGMYQIAEKVEAGVNRVEIDQNEDILFEKDNYAKEEPIFGFQTDYVNGNKRGFRIISPEDETMVESCKSKLIKAEIALYGKDDEQFEKYFDLESWAKMYLLQMFTMNSDSYYGSLYFYYNGDDGKLYACSPWDFDWSLGVSWGGTSFYTDPMQYDVGKIEWIKPMLTHRNFLEAVVKAYYEGGVKEAIEAMPALVDKYGEENRASAMMNQVINDIYYYPKDIDNYEDSVAYIREICVKRAVFLENLMRSYATIFKYKVD